MTSNVFRTLLHRAVIILNPGHSSVALCAWHAWKVWGRVSELSIITQSRLFLLPNKGAALTHKM